MIAWRDTVDKLNTRDLDAPEQLPILGGSRAPCVRTPLRPGAGLVASKSIGSLADVDPQFGDRFYLLGGNSEDAARLVALGAVQGAAGICVERDGFPNLEALDDRLPQIARLTITPLWIEVAPPSALGAGLEAFLSPECFGSIAKEVLAGFGGRCQVCGESWACKPQPVWDYYEPIDADSIGVQRLLGLMCMCGRCRNAFNIHFHAGGGRIPMRKQYIAGVNRWSPEETDEAFRVLHRNWRRRGGTRWGLDLSYFGEREIETSEQWRSHPNGILTAAGPQGEVATVLLGVRWREASMRVAHPSRDPADAYYK